LKRKLQSGAKMPKTETKMEKICISLLKGQVDQMNEKVGPDEFSCLSEAIRAAVREYLERHPSSMVKQGAAACQPA
jgi:Arc/MetJ-type ribon-helix-helix transcriptional regulator